jgi:hypothetical protein
LETALSNINRVARPAACPTVADAMKGGEGKATRIMQFVCNLSIKPAATIAHAAAQIAAASLERQFFS